MKFFAIAIFVIGCASLGYVEAVTRQELREMIMIVSFGCFKGRTLPTFATAKSDKQWKRPGLGQYTV